MAPERFLCAAVHRRLVCYSLVAGLPSNDVESIIQIETQRCRGARKRHVEKFMDIAECNPV